MSATNASTIDQKKNQQEGEENSGTSPNNIKKPDTYGFFLNFGISLRILFYVGIIGSMGAYTVKTVLANNAKNCVTELFSLGGEYPKQIFGNLNGCKIAATTPLAESAKTSVIAYYFSHVFSSAISWNTTFIEKISHLLGALPNWAILVLYSIVSIPFFIVFWLFNWVTNLVFALTNLSYLFSEKQKTNCLGKKNTAFSSEPSNCSDGAWNKDVSYFSWKIIPVYFYILFTLLTSFFTSFYTTFTSLFSPLMMNFFNMENKKGYGFHNFILDMIVTNKPLWLILFSLILLSNTNAYLGGTYTTMAAIAIVVAGWKLK